MWKSVIPGTLYLPPCPLNAPIPPMIIYQPSQNLLHQPRSLKKAQKKKLNTSHKSSWVWQHFITQLDKGSKEKQNICQVPLPSKGGKACGAVITFDQTSSTRSMSQNLECRHNLSQSTVPEAGMMKNFVTNCKMEQVH